MPRRLCLRLLLPVNYVGKTLIFLRETEFHIETPSKSSSENTITFLPKIVAHSISSLKSRFLFWLFLALDYFYIQYKSSQKSLHNLIVLGICLPRPFS